MTDRPPFAYDPEPMGEPARYQTRYTSPALAMALATDRVERPVRPPTFTIYCVTHPASGRCYVGQTALTVAERWRRHWQAAHTSNTAFSLAIREYGRRAFTVETIQEMASSDLANLVESYEIASPSDGSHGIQLDRGAIRKPCHP